MLVSNPDEKYRSGIAVDHRPAVLPHRSAAAALVRTVVFLITIHLLYLLVQALSSLPSSNGDGPLSRLAGRTRYALWRVEWGELRGEDF